MMVVWWSEGFHWRSSIGRPLLPNDASLSDSCTSDWRCFSSLYILHSLWWYALKTGFTTLGNYEKKKYYEKTWKINLSKKNLLKKYLSKFFNFFFSVRMVPHRIPPIFVEGFTLQPEAPPPGPGCFGIETKTNWFSSITSYRFWIRLTFLNISNVTRKSCKKNIYFLWFWWNWDQNILHSNLRKNIL